MMQCGCQQCSILHISKGTQCPNVPGWEENPQDDKKIRGGGGKQGEEGTTGEGLPKHGYTAVPSAPLLGKEFSGCFIDVE